MGIGTTKMIPSAIYLRVSPTTKIKTASDLHQSLVESLNICMKDITHEGNKAVAIYIDEYISGKSSKEMPGFLRMLQDARTRTNTSLDKDIIHIGSPEKVPWKRMYARRVNRFGRNRADMIKAEIELSSLGISLKFSESGIDTDKSYGKSIMAFMAEQAEMDRIDILENISRGKAEYKANGGKFGRHKKELNINLIRMARKELPLNNRQTWRQLEKTFGASRTIMIERLKECGFWDSEKGCVK